VRTANRGVVYLNVETTPWALKAVDAAAALFKSFRAYRQQMADRRMLMNMADRELMDMGLYRGDIDRVLR
jgi:uncharacterized protein YjiS (DUF1127 family)